MRKETNVLLEVNDLVKHFPVRQGIFSRQVEAIKAVDHVSFTVEKGETLGLVGESGCGKTTTGRLILRLLEPTSGEIFFDGKSVLDLTRDELRELRKEIQIIFQDPYGSLNPRMTVKDILGEPLHFHALVKGKEKEKRVQELLEIVGLNSFHANRFPHEFSGGQRQRIGIARALAVNPKLIVCDEPVSALDVSIRAQIINLLQDLQEEFGLTYLFISHDLSVVRHISNRVAVMYLGKIVELSDKDELYLNPKHPYTQALISAIPIPDPTVKKERIILHGDVPSSTHPPNGCCFHTRCPKAMDICKVEEPPLVETTGDGCFVACHLITSSSN